MRGVSTRGIAHRETVCTIQAAFTGGSAHGPGMGKSTATIDPVEALPRVSAAIADRRSHRGTLRKVRSDDALVRWKALPIDTCPLAFTRGRAAAISADEGDDSAPENLRGGGASRVGDGASDGSASLHDSGRTRPNVRTKSACHGGRRPSRPGSARGAVKHAVSPSVPSREGAGASSLVARRAAYGSHLDRLGPRLDGCRW